MDKIADKVLELVQQQADFHFEPIIVTIGSDLKEDLHLDSLDYAELVIDTEDTFSIRLEDEELQGIKTVRDIVNTVKRKGGRL